MWTQRCDMTHAALTAIAVDRGELSCTVINGIACAGAVERVKQIEPGHPFPTPQRVLSLSGWGTLQYCSDIVLWGFCSVLFCILVILCLGRCFFCLSLSVCVWEPLPCR